MSMIDDFFKNKYAQVLLVFLAIVGVGYIYKNVTYTPLEMHNDMEEIHEEMHDHAAHNHEEAYEGAHIMGNGDVMLRSGEVVPDAVINEDGSVTMPDGTVLESVMDMRP